MKIKISKGEFDTKTIEIEEDQYHAWNINGYTIAHREVGNPNTIHISLKWLNIALTEVT